MVRNLLSLSVLFDAVLPPRCPGCGSIVDAVHRFCAPCWGELRFLGAGGCAHCGVPLGSGGDMLCGPCIAHPPRHDRVEAVVAYGPIARRIVLRMKYARRPGLGKLIASMLAARITIDPGALVLPVPLHRTRIWTRGFNQSAEIARALAKCTGLVCDTAILARTKATPPLRGAGPKRRKAIVRGAFRVAGEVRGRHIYLVDDVYTTGATVNACAAALKRSGAARVTVLCWARVIRDD